MGRYAMHAPPLFRDRPARTCWICEQSHSGDECPKCEPPEPLGPTAEELARERRRKAEEELARQAWWTQQDADEAWIESQTGDK